MSGRCRACDAVLTENEIVWDEERQAHDDLCYICKGIIADAEYEEVSSVYKEDTFDDLMPINNGDYDE